MPTRECDCKEFQDSGHTDECNAHYKTQYNPTRVIAQEEIAFLEEKLKSLGVEL